jgi:hypothetical protein
VDRRTVDRPLVVGVGHRKATLSVVTQGRRAARCEGYQPRSIHSWR